MSLDTLAPTSSLIDGLTIIDADLDHAAIDGVISPLAETSDRFLDVAPDPEFLKILRDRLYRMGYLAKRRGPDSVDNALTQAIKKLQHEAQLTVDGWIGSQTWNALQELFAFEPSTAVERWIDQSGLTSALRRAVYLRLVSFGVINGSARASANSLSEEHLRQWQDILVVIQAPGIVSGVDCTSADLVRYLFDLDKLSQLISSAAESLGHYFDALDQPEESPCYRFLNCLLQIELWLLGYDAIKPDGKTLKISRKRRRRAGARGKSVSGGYQYSQFYKVLRQFWRDHREPLEHARSDQIMVAAFHSLAELQHDESTETEKNSVTDLIAQVETQQSAVQEQWKSQSLMSRLWDGAKRVWRFLRRFIGGAIEKIKLLARAARQMASDSFSVVRRTFKLFADGCRFVCQKEVPGSNLFIAMSHQADFDFQVFLDDTVSASQQSQFLSGLTRQLLAFRVTIRLLRALFAAAMDAVSFVSGPWGWWRLIRSLIAWKNFYNDEDRALIESAYGQYTSA